VCTKRAPFARASSIIRGRPPTIKYPCEYTDEYLKELVPETRKGSPRLSWRIIVNCRGTGGRRVSSIISRNPLTSIARYRLDVRFDASVSSPRKITVDCWPTGFGLPIVTCSGPENAADRYVLIAWGIRASSSCWSGWFRFRESPWSRRCTNGNNVLVISYRYTRYHLSLLFFSWGKFDDAN